MKLYKIASLAGAIANIRVAQSDAAAAGAAPPAGAAHGVPTECLRGRAAAAASRRQPAALGYAS